MGGKTDELQNAQLKFLRSGFGKQVKSPQPSSAAWGFGTSLRDDAAKQYMSPEHAKVMQGNNSQGPVYKTYSAMGPQIDSKVSSSSNFGFGTSPRSRSGRNFVPGPGAYKQEGGLGTQRDSRKCNSARPVFGATSRDAAAKVFLDDELMKTFYGKESPGPCTYNIDGSVGKQADSKKESSPQWRQGTEERFKYDFIERSKDMSGAGQYGVQGAVGRQSLSPKRSLPVFSFGTSTRDASKKTFISKEHEKASYGEMSPGPATGNRISAIGKQAQSNRSTSPGWGFGTSQRRPELGPDAPGPGSYYA